MMRGRAIQVLLVLQGLWQNSATTQCDNDQVAYVQKDLKAWKGGALEVTAETCSSGDINLGDCNGAFGAGKCLECDPSGGQVVPTPGVGFSGGLLLCGVQSCIMASGTDASDFYQFKNSRDYLQCNFEGCRPFNVRNMAAVCCLGFSSCQNSDFQLHGDHSCGGDVCCTGGGLAGSTCLGSNFSAVRHMACIESDACRQTSVKLTGDLVVGGSGAATEADFTFTTGGKHCISLRGSFSSNNMKMAKFTFEQDSRVRMLCDSGTNPCQQVDAFLPSGSCFHITCEAVGACDSIEVLPLVPGSTDFQCFCSGSNCAWTNSYSYCSNTSGDPCGTDICPGTLPLCDGGGGSEELDCDALANAPPCGGDVTGDPHLRTLDGRHYTLLQQGNFLLWGFSGYETEVLATQLQVNGFAKKVPVDFEILTHYAGRASFTKGLLVVDQSQKPSQALEMTAQDCLWHHWDTSTWRPVESGLLNMTDPEGVHFGTFKLAKSKGQKKLELLINDGAGARTLAQLWISCRPGHQLSAKIKMSSQKDLRFVRGELAPGRLSLAAGLEGQETETATDAEFAVTSDWAALGGSPAAASYFKMFATKGPHLAFLQCTKEDKDQYAKTCMKYMGDSRDALYKEVLDDCIFDLCSGGGETSAELAAEIYHAE